MTFSRKLGHSTPPYVSQETLRPTLLRVNTRRQFLKMSLSTVAALLLLKQTASGQPTIPGPCDLTPPSDIGHSPDAFPETLERKPGVVLQLDSTRLLLGLKNPQSRELILNFLRDSQSDLLPEGIHGPTNFNLTEATVGKRRVNHTARRIWITSPGKPALVSPGFTTLLNTFRSELEWIGPVYRVGHGNDERGLVCPLPHVLLIKFAPSLSNEEEDKLIKRLDHIGLRENPEKSRYLNLYRYFVMMNPLQPVYRIADHIKKCEQRYITATRFENMPLISNLSYIPTDPGYPVNSHRTWNPAGQWNMVAIKAGNPAYAQDVVVFSSGLPATPTMNYSGWDISTGSSEIAVWLIDTMCDLQHPDLAGQFLTQGIDLGNMEPPDYVNFDPVAQFHGTHVAGILAAGINNQNRMQRGLGIAGLAGTCRLIPLSWSTQSDVELENAFNYAADNWNQPNPATPGTNTTARVVCLSWGLEEKDEDILDLEQIDSALCKCAENGLIICAAAMNNNADGVAYPARHPMVIACGASTKPDAAGIERRRSTSNFGPGLSVVAPGERIPTTNSVYHGDGNLDPGRDKYVHFSGTSAATPHVAGLAALLLSINPGLINRQVRKIIERTADKINDISHGGMYEYLPSTHPNGSWNKEVGYGRINVLRALEMAYNPCVLSASQQIPNQPFVEAIIGAARLSGPSPLSIGGVYGPITIAPRKAMKGGARIELVDVNGKPQLLLVNARLQTTSQINNFRITFCGLFEAAKEKVAFRVAAQGNVSGTAAQANSNLIRVQGRVSDSHALWEEIATTGFASYRSAKQSVFSVKKTGVVQLRAGPQTLKADILVSMGFPNNTVELDKCGVGKT